VFGDNGSFGNRLFFGQIPQLVLGACGAAQSPPECTRPSSLIFSHDCFSAIVANQIERNSERDNVLEKKQAEIVHVMDAVNHDGVIRSRDQHAACGEEHAD
jgi:hypothetical protein